MRRWTAASLLVVTALYAWVARQWVLAALLALILVGALATRARLVLGRTAALAATAAVAVAGAAAGWLAPLPLGVDVLRKPWPAFAFASLLAGAARLFQRPPDDPSALALLPGLIALMACGETAAGRLYAVVVVAWIALSLQALRAADRGRPAWSEIPRRDRTITLALLAAATVFVGVSTAVLPPLSRWTERRVLGLLGDPRTGFSDHLNLGSLDGMLDSDEVVMRVAGPRADYLRGAVFDRYSFSRWDRRVPGGNSTVRASAQADGEGRVRISVVGGARNRYFLPLGAHAVSTTTSSLRADRYGVLRVTEGAAGEVSFDFQGPQDFPTIEPQPADLELPDLLQRTLKQLASEWTQGAATPEAKVEAITVRLRSGFTYSRTFQRRRRDPLLDFLLDDRRGHCEYFASATALLSRAAGVPARVVIGYRVAEENPLGDYWVVREKNAHAWAEVYLPGKGFVTVDATPAEDTSNLPHRSAWLRAALDVVSAWSSNALAQLTLADLVKAGVVLIVAGVVVRQVRRSPRKRREKVRTDRAERAEPRLAGLLAALARKGMRRGESEPIERFAGRLEEGGAREAAEVLRRWAAFRYGGIGVGEDIAREMEQCAERIGRWRRSSPGEV